jgi:hypothetical protein
MEGYIKVEILLDANTEIILIYLNTKCEINNTHVTEIKKFKLNSSDGDENSRIFNKIRLVEDFNFFDKIEFIEYFLKTFFDIYEKI